MCGIIGIFNKEKSKEDVITALQIMKARGKDGSSIIDLKKGVIGHCLHAIVNHIPQPLQEIKEGSIFSGNCEIYNWKQLAQKYCIEAKNDADLLFQLLEQQNIEKVLEQLDGVYAFIYQKEGIVYAARDLLGVKPLWYSHTDSFALASEKKALEGIGFETVTELHPRQIFIYDIENNTIERKQRPFFKINIKKDTKNNIKKNALELLKKAVLKRIPNQKIGVLFSGGIDSTFIALILKKYDIPFTCYTAALEEEGLKGADDLKWARKAAKELNFELNESIISLQEVPKYLQKIVPLIEDTNVVKVGVALPFYLACESAKKDGVKVIFSGLGSEELFAGYQRHKNSIDVNNECLSGLRKMYERDLYRDDVVTMANSIELRIPFLDKELTTYALTIPQNFKIDEQEKQILREASLDYGMPKDIALRKKKAAQYGSNFDKALDKLAKQNKESKSSYLRQFYPKKNLKLGALLSGGKDSVYAMYVMQKQNYDINCVLTIRSINLDSYMFHTPAIDIVKLQAESMNIPLIEVETKGEKEKELEDLKTLLQQAKDEKNIDGVITGALFSNYQRERIEKICDKLGLKVFSPLWHMEQETEMRELLRQGFKIILTKVAAEGLDKSWVGRNITEKDVDELVKLKNKIGLNIAGEGGEFESLTLDSPLFTKQIVIEDSIIEEDGICATLNINKASLKH